MKTLLVLGASEGQLPVYWEARRLGLRTIGVDQNPRAVAASEADEFLCVSTRNERAVRRAVGRRPIAGVTSPASDASALSVRRLSLAYRTPFCVSEAAARASIDKAVFRRLVDRLKLPRYGWVRGTRVAELCARARTLRFPIAVKPCDSSGSKGISILSEPSQLEEAVELARGFASGGQVIVEEFVDGVHCSAECLIADHRPAFMAVMQRTMTPPPRVVTLEQLVPAAMSEGTAARLERAVTLICAALDLDRGPLNLDFVLSRSGEVHLVELAARPGGNGISRLVERTYGVNLAEAAVRVAVGDAVEIEPRPHGVGLLRILEAPHDGVVAAIRGADEVAAMPETADFELFVEVGSPVLAYTEAAHKVGYLAVTAATAADARAALDRALAVLHLDIPHPDE
ncbi:MAG: ATP-grasp domain-containing protein [Gaiellaceae bacterium]